jgi:hypothetical protein
MRSEVAMESPEPPEPPMPFIATILAVIIKCKKIHENVQYNENICNSLMERVETAELAIKTLKRRKQENDSNFGDREYCKVFLRFLIVMKKIKSFIKDVSQIQGFKKYVNAYVIKDRFHILIKEFEAIMSDMNFTMAIADEEQRRFDRKCLNEDIDQMNEVFILICFSLALLKLFYTSHPSHDLTP